MFRGRASMQLFGLRSLHKLAVVAAKPTSPRRLHSFGFLDLAVNHQSQVGHGIMAEDHMW
jgi:hypothetical protein